MLFVICIILMCMECEITAIQKKFRLSREKVDYLSQIVQDRI